jgi:hypothetical protein
LAASRDQRPMSAGEGVGDCAAAVEASAAEKRTNLQKELIIVAGAPILFIGWRIV